MKVCGDSRPKSAQRLQHREWHSYKTTHHTVVNTQYEVHTPTLKNISGHEDCRNDGADDSTCTSSKNTRYRKLISLLEYNSRDKREATPDNTIHQFRAWDHLIAQPLPRNSKTGVLWHNPKIWSNDNETHVWNRWTKKHCQERVLYKINISDTICKIRGLLEKYPTFGREKETGLLGALDT